MDRMEKQEAILRVLQSPHTGGMYKEDSERGGNLDDICGPRVFQRSPLQGGCAWRRGRRRSGGSFLACRVLQRPHTGGMYMEEREEAIWMVSSASKPALPHDCSTLIISGNSVASSCVLCLCMRSHICYYMFHAAQNTAVVTRPGNFVTVLHLILEHCRILQDPSPDTLLNIYLVHLKCGS